MKPIIAIPCIIALLYRAHSRHSLTPLGLLTAGLTASIHALHPWSTPFALLGVFFLIGTAATKVKHDVKSRLTLSSSGSQGGEGPRTHVQVLANSGIASALILLQVWKFAQAPGSATCLAYGDNLLIVGIVANYASVAADTLSSELGILSRSKPRLITTGRTVPPGTNGGVTAVGLLAGLGGSFIIAITSAILLPFCVKSSGPVGRVLLSNERRGWGLEDKVMWVLFITVLGAIGSVLDSVLGAVLQGTVEDKRTGKVIEGSGGTKVLTSKSVSGKGGRILHGSDILDNNQVNLLMAVIMSMAGIAVASRIWDVPMSSIMY
jgi:uncharacterized protein (TIGR00297 family)